MITLNKNLSINEKEMNLLAKLVENFYSPCLGIHGCHASWWTLFWYRLDWTVIICFASDQVEAFALLLSARLHSRSQMFIAEYIWLLRVIFLIVQGLLLVHVVQVFHIDHFFIGAHFEVLICFNRCVPGQLLDALRVAAVVEVASGRGFYILTWFTKVHFKFGSSLVLDLVK